MIRNLLVVGGDERARRLAGLLESAGYQVNTLGLLPGDERAAPVSKADALLFPYPYAVKKQTVPTLTGLTLYPDDVLDAAWENVTILTGEGLEPSVEAAQARGKKLRVKKYMEYEPFLQANAELSAEAAVWHAMGQTEKAMTDLRLLVIGYGRFGRGIAKRLHALGGNVTVAARREEQRALIRSDGMKAISMAELDAAAPASDLVLNTVPATVLSPQTLDAFPSGIPLLELASAPYGFDREAALNAGLRYELLPGLPSSYAPQSAAQAMLKACVALLSEAGI